MGSIAQDNRHEEMFQKAKNHLSIMEDIDLKRD